MKKVKEWIASLKQPADISKGTLSFIWLSFALVWFAIAGMK